MSTIHIDSDTSTSGSSRTILYVTASEVRAWALKRGLTVGKRGHINKSVVEAFNRAHRVKQYINTNPWLKAAA